MKTIYSFCTYLLIALGTGHTLLTPIFYPGFSADTLWFAGTGLSLVFLGLLNISAEQVSERSLRMLCVGANLLGTLFIILVMIVLPEIQALLAVLAMIGVTSGSIAMYSSRLPEQFEEA